MTDAETVKKLKELLSDDLYSGSKDWRSGDIVERVEWLIHMYEKQSEETDYVWDLLTQVRGQADI